MAMVFTSLKVDKFTKDKSIKDVNKVMENVSMKMEDSIKVCGNKIVKSV